MICIFKINLDYRKAKICLDNYLDINFKLKKIIGLKICLRVRILKDISFRINLDVSGEKARMKKKRVLEKQETLYKFNKTNTK